MTEEDARQGEAVPEETVATVYRLLTSALSGARAGGGRATLQGEVFRQVLAELSRLDPALQRKAARALVTSGGDPEAVRAALRGEPDRARSEGPHPMHASPRPPTVVDARGGFPWVAVLLAIAIAAAASAAWFGDQ